MPATTAAHTPVSPEPIDRLIQHAQERYPHFESERGQTDIRDARNAVADLLAQRADLAEALAEILELAEDREDVLDGPSTVDHPQGQPRPNDWMRVATLCRAALKAGR